MARGKAAKKDSLSVEERLEQALVADWEQPYKVPSNWVWTRLGEVFQWGSGGTPSRKIPNYYTGTIPWIKTGELCDGYLYDTEEKITEEAVEKSSAKLFPIGTVAVAMYGATIGKVAILGVEATTNQACACAKPNNKTAVKFLFYYAISQKDNFIKKGKGGAQPNISQEIIKAHYFPLPPLTEQQRIVDRIESLFAKLDEAKEKAQAALDSFENRKAAILHMAFTGELTNLYSSDINKILQAINEAKTNLVNSKKIQKQKNFAVSEHDSKYSPPKNWVIEKIGNVAFVTKLAGFEYTKYINLQDSGEVPVLRAQNVRKGYLDITNLKYISSEISHILTRSVLEKTSILITFIGAGIGDVCIFDKQERYHLAPNIAKVEIYNGEIEVLLSKFILYYLLSSFGQEEIFKNMKSTAQPSLSMETIRDIIIPIAPTAEQTEIVRILDSIFEKEQQAKELASVIEKIDLMKKAILARAFRGELGTNDPKEESAIELLKEIIAEKQPETNTRAQATSIPKHVDVQLKTNLEREVYRAILKNETVDMDILFGLTKNFNELMVAVNALEKKGLVEKTDGRYRVK